ncbi:MAG TPA: MCE family protein [Pseudonocardia sp.]|jgi:phospholipid/cholesterol/gamma-HCH transport system substrate-binding protein|nr:MCE family protein [Pseudonocardia sp.]
MSRIRSLRDSHPFLLGLVATGVVVAVVLGALAVGELGLGKTTYKAEFARTGELRPGDEVRIAGLNIGEVRSVGLEGDHVLVTFRAQSSIRLGQATSATIKLATLLGNRYLELTPSGPDELRDDRIPIAHTSVPYDLQDVLQKGTPIAEQLDGAKLRQALAATAVNLRDEGPRVGAALDGLSRLSDVVIKRRDQVSELIDNVDAVSDMVDQRSGRIYALMGQSDTLLRTLLRRRDLIRGLLEDAASFTRELNSTLKENRPEIRRLLSNARDLTDLLREQDASINRALQLLAPASRYLTNAAGNGPYLEANAPYFIIPDDLLCQAGAVAGCK